MRPDWSATRALIESHAKVDALDMTWVRFTMMIDSMRTILRIEARAERSADEEFRDNREGSEKTI